jgi:hypothetical protein
MKRVILIAKPSMAKLAILAKEVFCDYCKELRFSTLIHNTSGWSDEWSEVGLLGLV